MKLVKTIAALLFVPIVAACGSNAPSHVMPDGRVLAAATVGTSADASFTMGGLYRCAEVTKDSRGRVVSQKGCVQEDGQANIGPTVGGQMAVAAVGGIGAAAVQGAAGIIGTKIKADAMVEAAASAQGDTWIIQGGQAVAASNSEATNTNTSTNTNTAKGGQGGQGGRGGSGGNAQSNAGAASNAANNTNVNQSGSFGGGGCGQPVCGKAF